MDTATPAPVTPGTQTTEYKLAKVTTALASVIAILGTIGAFVGALSPAFAAVPAFGKWLAIGGAVVASLTQAAYGLQRTAVKIAAISAGETAAAAQTATSADEAAAKLAA